MNRETKKTIIKKFKTHKSDTGSARVQIAILTERISYLSSHLEQHKKDVESRRGLLGLVAKRRKLLNYLKFKSPEEYTELTQSLSLK
jgi:small subunit ribosomal protein S15